MIMELIHGSEGSTHVHRTSFVRDDDTQDAQHINIIKFPIVLLISRLPVSEENVDAIRPFPGHNILNNGTKSTDDTRRPTELNWALAER